MDKKSKIILMIMTGLMLVFSIVCLVYANLNCKQKAASLPDIPKASATDASPQNEYSEEDYDKEGQEYVDSKIQELFAEQGFSEKKQEDKKKDVEKLLIDLSLHKWIKKVDHDDSEMMYTFEYRNGFLGGISLQESDAQYMNAGIISNPVLQLPKSDAIDGKLNVLVSYSLQNNYDSYHEDAVDGLDESIVNVSFNQNCTVDDMRNLSGYNVYILALHGNYYEGKTALMVFEDVTLFKYWKDLHNKNIAKIQCVDGSRGYVIFPSFFKKNYSSDAFENQLIEVESCRFFGCDCKSQDVDKRFANVFLDLSAEAVIGFHNSVCVDYATEVIFGVINNLVNGMNIQDALDIVIDEYGDNDGYQDSSDDKYKAYPVLMGDVEFELPDSLTIAGSDMVEDDENEITTITQESLSVEEQKNLYAPIIDEYREIMLHEEYKRDDSSDDYLSYCEDCNKWEVSAAGPYRREYNYYSFYDVDGDGILELFICDAMYTIKDGKPIGVYFGWSRNSYTAYDNSVIYNIGSGGAAYTTQNIYKYKNGELDCIASINYIEDAIYYGEEELEDSLDIGPEFQLVSQEFADAKVEELTGNPIQFESNPIIDKNELTLYAKVPINEMPEIFNDLYDEGCTSGFGYRNDAIVFEAEEDTSPVTFISFDGEGIYTIYGISYGMNYDEAVAILNEYGTEVEDFGTGKTFEWSEGKKTLRIWSLEGDKVDGISLWISEW